MKDARIILAVSNLTVRLLLKNHLDKAGFDTSLATSGAAAVELWQDDHFDLVILDATLPELPGAEAAALIRQQEATRPTRTPIILLLDPERPVPPDCPADRVLSKPVSKESLLESISLCLHRHAEDTPAPPAFRRISPSRLLEEIGGNHALLLRLAKTAAEEIATLTRQATEALAAGDGPQLRLAAHTLKTTFRHWGATRAQDTALAAEKAGGENRLADAKDIVKILEDESAIVCEDLISLV